MSGSKLRRRGGLRYAGVTSAFLLGCCTSAAPRSQQQAAQPPPGKGGAYRRARGLSARHRAPIARASAASFRRDEHLNNAQPSCAPAAPASPPHAAIVPHPRIPRAVLVSTLKCHICKFFTDHSRVKFERQLMPHRETIFLRTITFCKQNVLQK